MLRAIGFLQKDTARITRCANQTVVDTERWLTKEDYHKVARICDDQSIKKMVAAEAIYWGLEAEDLVKLDRLTQDDILRHYRADYLEIVDMSDPRFLKHTADVLNLLDTYASQLRIGREPEYFLLPPKRETADDKERLYLRCVRDVVPSIDSQIDDQIDSETISIAPQIEMEPSFAALKGHYEGTELWGQIQTHKQKYGKYISAGMKTRRSTRKLFRNLCIEKTDAVMLWDAIREQLAFDLAPVRVKLNLQGIDTDKSVVLEKLPDPNLPSVQQGAQLLKKYLASVTKTKTPEHRLSSTGLIDLLERLVKTYETVKGSEANMISCVKEEKLKGALPIGTKCKFCP